MIMIRINRQDPLSGAFKVAHASAARKLEGADKAVRKLQEKDEGLARERLDELGIDFFEKDENWFFTAESGEKIALPAGWYTWQGGTLHQIIITH